MAITDNDSAFAAAGAVSIGLSQMFTVTAGATDPTYLVLTLLDRNEYTAAASGATGSLSGNGNTLGFSGVGGDERGDGIVFTYTFNSATGQYGYYDPTYGWFNQVTYNSSSSSGDVTNLSLFGTNSSYIASMGATSADLMMEMDASGYLGSATVVTQPGYTAAVPTQATPGSIASVAKSFVGDAWNMNGCWVLASTIAAEAGASLPVQSTLVGLSGQANGEWIVAFNGPAGQTGNWQNMVTAGEIIVFQPAGGGGHVTTCVSGTGSTAMLVDNAEYVNGGGQIQNPANDGSSADIIVAAPHAASQEWSGVAASSVVIYELDTPIVTTTVTSDSLACLATQSLGSLFSATDPANKAITAWQVYDTATSDTLVLGGTAYSDHTAANALTASTLGAISLLAGPSATTDTLEVRAFNGSYWGDWGSLSVTIAGAAPSAPVLQSQTPNQSWTGGTAVALTLGGNTFTDPQGEALTYAATLSNGQALPGWLGFNAATDTFSGTAPSSAQSLGIKVTATDTSGLSVSDSFSATVIGAPVLATPTPNQSWTGGAAVTLALPANTFADPQGQALTYTATLSNGQALPGWLGFNAATDTFSGTAPSSAQSLGIKVTATDTSGLSVSDSFSATVIGAPVLATPTPNQSWTGGAAVSLALPANTFADPQGQALTYTATLSNGQALPGWLGFNAATDTFSGTAPSSAQTLGVKVTATDTSGLSVSDSFSATVIGAPVLATPTPNQSWTGGIAVALTLPANTFTDPQGEALTYAATLSNGQALPGWLGFNAATDTFSGTAPSTAQSLGIKVTATDTSGLSVSDSFSATVIGAPVLTTPTPNQSWTGGAAVSLALPANTFADPQGQALTYAAILSNGQAMPGWLGFNAATDTLSGIAPSTAQSLGIKVTATDTSGLSVSDSFSATVIGAPVLATPTPNQSWTGGAAVSLALPANTFADPQGQALTYAATLSNGQALPGWLGFNAATDTFSGTAPATVQTLNIAVTATDTSGLAVSDSFSATVTAAPVVPIVLTRTPTVLTGGAADDVYVATNNVLYSGDRIDGGSGLNTLDLQGGGTFDLRAPAVLNNIQVVNATEGQSAAMPTIYLRNGLDLTLDLASAPIDPQLSGSVVHGANNNDVINLGSGNDTVYLGGTGETVFGGSGVDKFYVTAATIGATIAGGTGTNNLYVQGGGSAAMGTNIDGIGTVYLTNAGTSYNFTANATQGLAIHASTDTDTIVVGDASQTVFGSSSSLDVLATAANAGVTVKGGTGSAVLEITTGGTIALNSGDNKVTVQLDAASTLSLPTNSSVAIAGSAGNDVFVTPKSVLRANQQIDGGGGVNTLTLQGGGTFDLRAPAVLNNIQVVQATEGQSTGLPVIYLRNGLDLTLNLASAPTNPQSSGAVVYGGTNNDVINLASGNDTVYLGGTGEVVYGGGGTDKFYVTGATIGATIVGGTGTNTLYVQGGGSAAMGSNITGIGSVFLANAGASYDFTANASHGLVIHASTDSDTIAVGDASQTVDGSSGSLDVLATAANAGVAIHSGTGSTQLDVTTGGTAVLNSADNNVTVVLDAANTTLTLNHMKFIHAEGTGGNDTIIAGTAGQVLTGGGAGDMLEDAGHYGVTFQDTLAGIAVDTLVDFTKKDTIDITDLGSVTAPPVYIGTYGASGSGVLAVTNGTGTVDIHMAGLTAGSSFHTASDTHGGTLITYS